MTNPKPVALMEQKFVWLIGLMPQTMNKVRYINLDRREWFEIGSYGSIMAPTQQLKPNPRTLTCRQQGTRYGAKYETTMVYGRTTYVGNPSNKRTT